MRAAAILGPGNVAKAVAAFQRATGAEWTSLIEQSDVAVIFGGDGTVHRHLAELVELEIPVLVVPCGSGNDFARALGIRRMSDAVVAWKRFAESGQPKVIDLGVVSSASPQGLKPPKERQPVSTAEAVPFPSGPAQNVDSLSHFSQKRGEVGHPSAESGGVIAHPVGGTQASVAVIPKRLSDPESAVAPMGKAPAQHKTYFCCVAGVGIDTAIARRSNALPKWLRARGGYALSASREFIRYAPFPIKISSNGTSRGKFQPTLLAAAANTPTYGGGMKIAPHAQLGDGKLDLCIIEGMNVFKLFCLFPTVFFGRHLGIRQVHYEQTEHVCIETELPLDIYADGEYVCQTPVEISVAHSALKVISP